MVPLEAPVRYNSVGIQRFLGGAVPAEDRVTGPLLPAIFMHTHRPACCPILVSVALSNNVFTRAGEMTCG